MVVLYLVSNRMVLSYNRQTTQYNRFSLLNPSSVFFVVFFTLVFAVRYNVGVDFVNYLDEYQSVYKLEYSKNEILYKNIGLFLNSIGAHPSVFFGCFVFLQITFFLLAVKKEIFVLPFLIIFLFANSEIQTWMNIIRSATGMCIWLYAVDFATDRKLWKYVALCIFASCFHRISLAYIFLYPVILFACKIEITRKWQYGIVACAFIVRILFETFATQIIPLVSIFQSILGGENDYYANYDVQTMLMDLDNEKSGTGIAFLAKLIIDLIIIFNSNKIIKFYDSSKFKTYYFLFIVALFTFYCFPDSVISFSRPFRYFYVFRTLMLGYFSYYLYRNRNIGLNGLCLFFISCLYLSLFLFNQVFAKPEFCVWYQTWFNYTL